MDKHLVAATQAQADVDQVGLYKKKGHIVHKKNDRQYARTTCIFLDSFLSSWCQVFLEKFYQIVFLYHVVILLKKLLRLNIFNTCKNLLH